MSIQSTWQPLKATVGEFLDDSAIRLAAAIAFYTIFSLGPVLVIVIRIAGAVWGEEAARGELVEQISGAIGRDAGEALESLIQNAGRTGAGTLATAISIGLLIFAATGVFAQIKDALNTIWGVKAGPGRGFVGFALNRVVAFAVVIGIGAMLLTTLVAGTVISAMGDALPLPGPVLQAIEIAASIAILTLAFATMFKWLPDVRIEWRDVWIGAAVTAVLFAIGKVLLGLYLARSSVASVYGAAGSIIAVLVWVYYSAVIVLFGAEFTQVEAQRAGRRILPSRHAVAIAPSAREDEAKTPKATVHTGTSTGGWRGAEEAQPPPSRLRS